MTLRLPNVHQVPHMHRWADDLLSQNSVAAHEVHDLAYSIEQHGLEIDNGLMQKLDRVRAMPLAAHQDESSHAVDVNSHLNSDDAADLTSSIEEGAALAEEIENLAQAMDNADKEHEQLSAELDANSTQAASALETPAPKLVPPRKRGSRRRT